MRRSAAPSSSQRQNFLTPSDQVTQSNPLYDIFHDKASNHLKELEQIHNARLQQQEQDNESQFPISSQSQASTQLESQPILEATFYNVVYGKLSTKKHKTWEGDGILEVKDRIATLTDADGRLVASERGLKILELMEGSRLVVGGNAVEIVDRITRGVESSSVVFETPKPARAVFKPPLVVKRAAPRPPQVLQPIHPNFSKMEVGPAIIFSVTWGAVTTKKHKTFPNDGTLEVRGACARLKDEKGKTVSVDYKFNAAVVNEGDIIIVEGKELQIVENISRAKDEEEEMAPPPKRIKAKARFIPPMMLNYDDPSGVVDELTECAQAKPEEDVEPLIMPPPPYLHNMRYNLQDHPITPVVVPAFLTRQLRPHQRDGITFLYCCLMGFNLIRDVEYFGAILADEMGLGKSLQCIATIFTLLRQGPYAGRPVLKRVLIVAPSSLVENWDREILKWLPHERVFTTVLDGKNRALRFSQQSHIPVLLASYEMLVKHWEEFENLSFDLMICDEGHRLKNAQIKQAQMLSQLNCSRKVILTGTPVQNDLQEFYSLIDFVNPGILGSYQEFRTYYETPMVKAQQPDADEETKEEADERAAELSEIMSAFMLRRTQDVINQYLPRKHELDIFCKPSQAQQRAIFQVLESYQFSDERVSPLQVIQMLKKICNHPSFLIQDPRYVSTPQQATPMSIFDSAKVELVFLMLDRLIEHREKIVLVSHSTKTLDYLQNLCEEQEYKFCRLDGTTPTADRGRIISIFNDRANDTFVFLLSAKAGGAGLNLVGASRLLLFDNDWNPATDLQALSRIWRDGQDREVFIYRLITLGTIEEKIFQRQVAKTTLGGFVMDQRQQNSGGKFSDEELKDLFSVTTNYDECATHAAMGCQCPGDGTVPAATETTPIDNAKALQMHQLFQWEHHATPIEPQLLDTLCLDRCDDIIKFIFRTQTN